MEDIRIRSMNKKRSIAGLLAVAAVMIVSAVSGAYAQSFRVDFDFSTFRYDTSNSLLEFYYSFDIRSMKLVEKDSTFSDTLLFHVTMQKVHHDSTRYYESWGVPVTTRDTAGADMKSSLVGQIGIAIPPGNYLMFIKAIDCNDTSRTDSVEGPVMVPEYSFDKFQTSDIELCSEITEAGSGPHGIFYKNTYNVIPNPKATYGAGLPIIYYYVEVYNIPDSTDDSLFTVEYQVRDAFGQVRKSREVTKTKFGTTSVEVGTVNGSNLKTGTYTFVFTAIDSAANLYSTSSRRFFVYNPGLGAPESTSTDLAGASILSSVFGTMSSEQLDREFAEARYISSSGERAQYKEVHTLSGKRQFLYDFWKRLNPNPALKTNSYRTEYLQRVAYANEHFTVGSKEGWQSDRGRVYIVYGKPDQIDRHPNEGNSKPYEIWYYNSVQGGVSFDFIDRTGFGDYQLVNSTARNEIHDDNWQQYLGN